MEAVLSIHTHTIWTVFGLNVTDLKLILVLLLLQFAPDKNVTSLPRICMYRSGQNNMNVSQNSYLMMPACKSCFRVVFH